MGEFSLTHILLVAVIFLVFFGPNKLPALGQSLGKAIRGFKESLNEIEVKPTDVSQDRLEKPQSPPTSAQASFQNQQKDETKKPEHHS